MVTKNYKYTPCSRQEAISVRPLELLLSRLDNPKRVGNGYLAKCPAHDDKHPSLAIHEKDDGALLLTCRAGCQAAVVLHTIGLELKHLFPRPYNKRRLTWEEKRQLHLFTQEATLKASINAVSHAGEVVLLAGKILLTNPQAFTLELAEAVERAVHTLTLHHTKE